VNYYSRFVANTLGGPVVLLGLVAARWAMDKPSVQSFDSLSPGELARRNQERRTRQKSDYYFAFFVVCECSLARLILFGGMRLVDIHVARL